MIRKLFNNSRFIRFGCVGVVGFIADYTVFSLMFYLFELPIIQARVVAFFCAATTTWYGNRILTFAVEDKGSLAQAFLQWQKFMCAALLSAVPNLVVFKVLSDLLPNHPIGTFVALVAGVLVGMISNFLFSRYWVFSQPTR
ncbi:GtrA family protein [Vibrio sp. T187]|uniref:GtrA family protein n=1 Tax=Vibrio TaxID=662 RepID=UPI0010C94942|nr:MULTISPECIES: GtrA family protein [Vibrio]MBW3694735.1 GtrA family protein [Vibrio sp. T187]